MLDANFSIKDAFFNQQAVRDALDEATRRSMVKSLASYRRRLINTYRRGGKPSKPGDVPTVHSRNRYANLRNVLFGYDTRTQTGVAGPIRLAKSRNAVPGILEHGGTVDIPAKLKRNGSRTKALTVRIAPRPASSVALDKSIKSGEIIAPFANSVKP